MFCSNCGKQISNSAQFCGYCGTRVEGNAGSVSPVATAISVNNAADSGTLLASYKHISKYRGTPAAGYAQTIGVLSVFNNRLEFNRKAGDALLNLNVIGMALAAANPVETILLENISELKEGKYMGFYKTLVVTEKNGDIWSFCPAKPGGSIAQDIINLLKPYMQS